MKKVLLLATGGTIASTQGPDGLEPQPAPLELLHALEEFRRWYQIDYRPILNLDSSNIQAEEWQLIARAVYQELSHYDGIVITHGTDTMAYTASMLSFMLQNLDKPVVLTGSQIPITSRLSDARSNLATALAAVEQDVYGVSIAFNHKLIRGCRAVKVRTMSFDAFESVNSPERGDILASGIRLAPEGAPLLQQGGTKLCDALCNDVFLLKLIPGTNPKIFDTLLNMQYKGVVLEAFGAGGLHFIRRDLSEKIKQLVDNGVAVVVCSQCLYEPSDCSIYEVGRRMLATGIIQSCDMTTEAAVTKLMWALGQTRELAEIRRIFATNYAGEISC
ncbi:MAG: asparaginase [Anaerotruncus sp.]|nr:asparaginase [Anaerotruncus sp.]